MNVPSLYIHIPFCRKKCAYCDFNSVSGQEHLLPSYVQALNTEMKRICAGEIYSLYIGGGTPSLLTGKQCETLFTSIAARVWWKPEAEITVEINPESITREKLAVLRACGVNRLSIGLQSPADTCLKYLGRIHTYDQFLQAYIGARTAGFDNVSVDLIYGIPGLSCSAWESHLKQIIALKPEHLSIYGLSIEHGTLLYQQKARVDDDLSADHYTAAARILAEHGYHRYEISNFAMFGRESRHNQVYWNRGEYFGVGAGAASFIGNKRWSNISTIAAYINAAQTGGCIKENEETLTPEQEVSERFFLGLRLAEGIICGEHETRIYNERLRQFEQQGLINFAPPRLTLTDKGMLLANQVLREVMA
jgi:oxygen-independent coproporphyrinogen-3 oxidase